ncbi:DUF2254 domain-containing protein [Psychroflexus sp. CAK8W]|uniref:DUF2254 domain-containing protein n=1 Tax=Psychroflexus longus TaxID=2873596 RepID=A0ABS7XLL5_9FLAO|nr:DUF2254 domain-containing protein [Psychroflexus longus]MBZ9779358.1 DUF2254 domain-containing protein [Psychroflexus longus]
MGKVKVIWYELTNSFWFVPILIILFSIALASSLILLDRNIDFGSVVYLRQILTESADSARSVLSTISGAMIGVAGTVFSITLVALTLASSQFGSRLLKNFMHERINQVVLGTYISTYVYCLIVLNVVKDNDNEVFIPTLSILVAIIAAIGNIILLIVFIHHISISIQADKVVSDISIALMKNIESIFSEELEGEEEPVTHSKDLEDYLEDYPEVKTLLAPKSGYLQYLHNQSLFEAAKTNAYIIVTLHRIGSYIVKGEAMIKLYSKTEFTKDSMIDFKDNFVIGNSRTRQQDAEHSIHQMVEIACRALSPGINDPFTAISCIDNLTSTLCYLTRIRFPSKYKFDDEDQLRYAHFPLTYQGMLDAAFLQIRQFSKGSPAVVIRLMEAMIKIHNSTTYSIHKKAVKEHAQMILKVAEDSFEESHDLEDMQKRSKIILEESSDE